jgi:hypothetical protein
MQKINQEEKMNISQVREKIGKVFHNVYKDQKTRIIVEKSGIVVGGVVSPFDLARLQRLDERQAEFSEMGESIRPAFNDQDENEILDAAVNAVRKVRNQK